jgi:hypothetical protein
MLVRGNEAAVPMKSLDILAKRARISDQEDVTVRCAVRHRDAAVADRHRQRRQRILCIVSDALSGDYR